MIAPSIVETEMARVFSDEERARAVAHIPLGRIGQPYDIAATALFLAGDDSSFITGQTLDVNGGTWMG